MLNDYLMNDYNGLSKSENVIVDGSTRITVLTERVIRIETGNCARFIDEPSAKFVNRNTDKVGFSVRKTDGYLFIETVNAIFKLKKGKFIAASLDNGKTFVKERGNLLGTKRTLDFTARKTKLNKGIMSSSGVTVIDDSDSLLFKNGEIVRREIKESDVYVFASLDYSALLNDFYLISGKLPMLPKFVFGNWWSRYHAYSDKEYLALLDKFQAEKIPLSVAVIDMDWHYVNVKEDFKDLYKNVVLKNNGNWRPGWTGYTFNKNLFPDHRAFLKELHNRGLKTTLNLHPADGVLPHEEAYEEMKKLLPTDPVDGRISFDFTNDDFINAYFDLLHKPLEKDGVDFWWIDWQQGKKSKLAGLDPLFALNHYHYLENSQNKRGLILSRYFGIGSHRYPLGFSGDTFINFPIIKFIPYFTSTAANVGYTLWSHDIGGHMFGKKDNELYCRFLQFGCFSPINRLHSSNMTVTGKEPWTVNRPYSSIAANYLRLRQRLIPYVYSEYVKSVNGGKPLLAPLYYYGISVDDSLYNKNAYMFGESLYVLPITNKTDKTCNLAVEKAYLPKGNWYDLFTQKFYGGGKHYLGRDIYSLPLLMKEGSILPLNQSFDDSINLPANLDVLVVSGTGEYELYEDDGESFGYKDGVYAVTKFSMTKSENSIEISSETKDEHRLIPSSRTVTVKLLDVTDADSVILTLNNVKTGLIKKDLPVGKAFTDGSYLNNGDNSDSLFPYEFSVTIKSSDAFNLTVVNPKYRTNGGVKDNVSLFFSKLQGSNILKEHMCNKTLAKKTKREMINTVKGLLLSTYAKRELIEIIELSDNN